MVDFAEALLGTVLILAPSRRREHFSYVLCANVPTIFFAEKWLELLEKVVLVGWSNASAAEPISIALSIVCRAANLLISSPRTRQLPRRTRVRACCFQLTQPKEAGLSAERGSHGNLLLCCQMSFCPFENRVGFGSLVLFAVGY